MTVTNADSDNTTKQVQVSLASVVEQPLHVPAVDQQGLLEVGDQSGVEVVASHFPHVVILGALLDKTR